MNSGWWIIPMAVLGLVVWALLFLVLVRGTIL